jgi:hypothetical protein
MLSKVRRDFLLRPSRGMHPPVTTATGHQMIDRTRMLESQMPAMSTVEEKVDYIYKLQRSQVAQLSKSAKSGVLKNAVSFVTSNKSKTMFLLLPFLIVIGSLWYLFAKCYPRAVFCWGDYGQFYQTIVARRKFIWGTVVISGTIGIIGNLFVSSLS